MGAAATGAKARKKVALVSKDAIVRAVAEEPNYLIDTATLTGAQIVSLGRRTPGIMGTEQVHDRVTGIAKATREGWLGDAAARGATRRSGLQVRKHRQRRRSRVQHRRAVGATPAKGATGVPVRTLAAVLADIAENG